MRTTVSVRRAAGLAASLAVGLLVIGATPAGAGSPTLAGQPDPTFSPDAPVGVTAFTTNRQFVDVAAQQDGKVVAVSDQGGDFYVARFNVDGSPDTSFAGTGTGWRTVDVGGAGKPDAALAVAVDAQNRIVVAGSGGAAPSDFAMVRLSPDGATVELNVHTHVANPAQPEAARDIAFQSDGTIVLAGGAYSSGVVTKIMTAIRLDPASGAPTGSPVTRGTGVDIDTFGVSVYPSGPQKDRIVVVGTAAESGGSEVAVTRAMPTGDVDYSFNAGSIKHFDVAPGNDYAAGASALPTGAVVLGGSTGTGDLFAARLDSSGALDPAFGTGGIRTVSRPGTDIARNHPLEVQPDGRILLIGDTSDGLDVGVVRLNADGSMDPAFGTNGLAVVDARGNDDGNAVSLDARGRILLAGDEGASAGFVARLVGQTDSDGDGVPDANDACPSTVGTLANGCPPAVVPEAVLKGKKVLLSTVLAKKSASAKCPAKASVSVKTKGKHGRIKVTKQLKTKPVTTGCLVKGKVRLPAKPTKSAAVKVTVKGTKLVTKRLVAARP